MADCLEDYRGIGPRQNPIACADGRRSPRWSPGLHRAGAAECPGPAPGVAGGHPAATTSPFRTPPAGKFRTLKKCATFSESDASVADAATCRRV